MHGKQESIAFFQQCSGRISYVFFPADAVEMRKGSVLQVSQHLPKCFMISLLVKFPGCFHQALNWLEALKTFGGHIYAVVRKVLCDYCMQVTWNAVFYDSMAEYIDNWRKRKLWSICPKPQPSVNGCKDYGGMITSEEYLLPGPGSSVDDAVRHPHCEVVARRESTVFYAFWCLEGISSDNKVAVEGGDCLQDSISGNHTSSVFSSGFQELHANVGDLVNEKEIGDISPPGCEKNSKIIVPQYNCKYRPLRLVESIPKITKYVTTGLCRQKLHS